jgi:DNA-binding GntR family transcriptional regulator
MATTSRRIVRGARLRDQIYSRIRGELEAGTLSPGERATELTLATRYGVSRTPVREALFQLHREGLLDLAERGYAVPIDSAKATSDRLAVRRLLDPELVRRSAVDATDAQLQGLTRALQRQVSAHASGKPAAFVKANAEFRSILVASCGNETLALAASIVHQQFQAGRSIIYAEARQREVTLEYETQLLKALEARDGDAAANVMTKFVDRLIMEATSS